MSSTRSMRPFGPTLRAAWLVLVVLPVGAAAAQVDDVAAILQGVRWGEPSAELLAQFRGRATVLQSAIDFGDSYTQVVLPDAMLGDVPLIAFFQMDKSTHGLKRIQLERPRHGVNPPAFQGVLAGLEAAFGTPDALCGLRPEPAGGYQAAAERVWRRDGIVVRAIFRDTTLQAFGGCRPRRRRVAGPCGLTGQLLVRISPSGVDGGACPAMPRP